MVYFRDQKSQFGQILECLAMKDVGKFFGRSVYLSAISYILWPFGRFCGHFGTFFLFWYIVSRKIWQPWLQLSSIRDTVWRQSSEQVCL
jgi:hypothetical protein